ncbi:NADH:flavin oxidoreductase/NADH oxidase [Acerihabitans sp. KWT182]|uniref:NADH:flavin oxidoreductase/NADH oxidase n=1 Tax=Acerihabitans sp. KWT182 TaxID=3157919 RepID=A0AAU7QGL7_9GAMM
MSSLFSPVTIGHVSLNNRIVIAPMCQFSATEGRATDWHMMHLGSLAMSGAGLLIIESTAVTAQGRITHADLGLWNQPQETALGNIVRAIRRYSKMPLGIQLSHAGRKAASPAPSDGVEVLFPNDPRGWPVVAPSPLAFVQGAIAPHALSGEEIDDIVLSFAAAARRAADIGINVIELHAAHGFLMHEFLSPVSNQRTDAYGGSLENRMRLTLRIFDAVKRAVKDDMAVGIRISATDWIDGGWDLSQSILLSQALAAKGCAYVHVSGGGLDPVRQALPPLVPGYQLPYAAAIKKAIDIPVIGVGLITRPQQAETALQENNADLIALGRAMLYDPRWPWHAADELGGGVNVPVQLAEGLPHGFKGSRLK